MVNSIRLPLVYFAYAYTYSYCVEFASEVVKAVNVIVL